MNDLEMTRRELLIRGGSTLAVLSLFDSPAFARALGSEGEIVVPFLDQRPRPPKEAVEKYGELSKPEWEKLDSWITPNEDFFHVGHYDKPAIRAEAWRLEIAGLVRRPRSFTLEELKERPRKEVFFTLECSGNNGFDWFVGGIGNAKWAGTPLAPVLEEAGIEEGAVDVVFFGSDTGEEEVRGIQTRQSFSRSFSVADAMSPANLLCYEMNGAPLPRVNGFPVRLIAPGWYGIANVKWLARIELIDTRWAGRFMAKDYVTLREEPHQGGETLWTQKVVGRSRIKSVAARVGLKDGKYRIYGAAWGAPIARVEVRIDDSPWRPTTIDRGREHEFAWKFWQLDWEDARPGEHAITSRAIDTHGNVQPAMDDPLIAGKHTYWESNGQIARRIRLS